MNAPSDPGGIALAMWRTLGRGDQARMIDQMMLEMGDHCPVPAFADLEHDARWWVENTTQAAIAAFFVEICARMQPRDFAGMSREDKGMAFKTLWNGMSPANQAAALKYCNENRKEADPDPKAD